MTKKEAVTNEVIEAPQTGVTLGSEVWGAEPESEDILIPKILVMQKLSKFVDDGVAKESDFVSSVDGQVLGTNDKPLHAMIFDTFKTWTVFRNGEFESIIPLTHENAELPYESREGGDVVTRNKTYNFYVLPVTDEGASDVPYVLSLSRSSSLAARKLLTMFARLRRMGKSSATKVIKFSTKKEKNDKGSWYSVDFEIARDATSEELTNARFWWEQVRAKSVAIDDSDSPKPRGQAIEGEVIPF
jgi:hypothetical protein